MSIGTYLIVSTDPNDHAAKDGPVLWDGAAPFALPPNRRLMLLADAIAAGYTMPSRSTAAINADALRDKADQAIASNVAFLALATPTNAQIAAQVSLLTREVTALIRLLLNVTDSTDGT